MKKCLLLYKSKLNKGNDSISEYSKANRTDLIEGETKIEKDILTKYLPAQKSEAEIRQTVKTIISPA